MISDGSVCEDPSPSAQKGLPCQGHGKDASRTTSIRGKMQSNLRRAARLVSLPKASLQASYISKAWSRFFWEHTN